MKVSRGIFVAGSVFLTILFLVLFYFILFSDKVIEKSPEKEVESFLSQFWLGKSKSIVIPKSLDRTNAFYLVVIKFTECFSEGKYEDFLNYLNLVTNDIEFKEDINLMRGICLVKLGKSFVGNVDFDSLRFKVNLYGYYKVLGILGDSSKMISFYKNLKRILFYAHDNDFLNIAVDIATNLMKLDFKDPEVMSYYGSTLTKYALYVNSPTEKVDYVARGSLYIDRAVEEYNDFLVPRLVRVFNYLSLPSFFNKYKYVVKDLDFLFEKWSDKKLLKVVEDYGKVREVEIPKEYLLSAFEVIEGLKDFPSEDKKRFLVMKENILGEVKR